MTASMSDWEVFAEDAMPTVAYTLRYVQEGSPVNRVFANHESFLGARREVSALGLAYDAGLTAVER